MQGLVRNLVKGLAQVLALAAIEELVRFKEGELARGMVAGMGAPHPITAREVL